MNVASKLSFFLVELKRGNVYRVAEVYTVHNFKPLWGYDPYEQVIAPKG